MKRSTLGLALLLLAPGCGWHHAEERIELGAPSDFVGVTHVERIVDGLRGFRGAPWNSRSAASFRADAYVTFDLGEVEPIEAAYVQGDNNDRFIIEISEDGKTFSTLWVADRTGGSGLQARSAKNLGGRARFVRLRAEGGDRWISVSELQLFSANPRIWPPRVAVDIEMTPSLWTRLALLVFAVLSIVAAIVHRRGSKTTSALWAVVGASAVVTAYTIVSAWPVDAPVINLSRAIAASVACAVVLRLGFRPRLAQQRLLTALLAAVALLSVLTFYNFGHPQFYDAAKRKPTYVHTWDLRVYFPAVKYFDELGYDGVYLASVKAYANRELGGSLDPIAHVRIRDLRDYEMRTVGELASEIHGITERFSPDRWTELEKDMSYFWKAMGKHAYLDSLRDHGGNATPAWLLAAYAIYRDADATEETFLWAALLDPLLLLIFFGVAWRTFGLRAALVCMVAYGATTVWS